MPTRRSALKAGAAVATLSALPPSIRALSTDGTGGKCVFIYDDGHETDLTKTLPVHRELDAPGCIAVVSGYLSPTGNYLAEDELQEFLDEDWEILSHMDYHRPVGQRSLTEDVEEGDTKLEVVSTFHGRFEGDPLEVVDDDGNAIRVTVEDRDEDDDVIYIKEPASESISASANGRVRFPAEFLREKLRTSKEELQELGVQARGFIAPFGIYDEWAAGLVAEQYEACGNGQFGNGINLDIMPYWVNRTQYADLSAEELDSLAEEAAEEDAILVLGSHSWEENLTESKIREAINAARNHGLEITTLHEALVSAGAVDEPSEETPTETPEETPEDTPEETPTETPEETPEDTPEETPEDTPEETPEDTPEETPEDTPEETPEDTPEETPEETPTQTPEETPDDTSESNDDPDDSEESSGSDDTSDPDETPTTPTPTSTPPSTPPPSPDRSGDSSPPEDSSERSEPPDAPTPEETPTVTPTPTPTATPTPTPSSTTSTPTATPTSTTASTNSGSSNTGTSTLTDVSTPSGTPEPTPASSSRKGNSSGRIPLLSDLLDWLFGLFS
jgi:hypothetical protein